jgi:hypothetical protein
VTTDAYLRDHVIPAAYALLPEAMASPAATALLMAIAYQESGCRSRVQCKGPARSFWQFERGGLSGVMGHRVTSPLLTDVLIALRYPRDVDELYAAMAHQDVLAACCARLLLWTLPDALPQAHEADRGWGLYVQAWRPGTPRPDAWARSFADGWSMAPAA